MFNFWMVGAVLTALTPAAILSGAESQPGLNYSVSPSVFSAEQTPAHTPNKGLVSRTAWRMEPTQVASPYGTPAYAMPVAVQDYPVDVPVGQGVEPPLAIPMTQPAPPQGMLLNNDPNTWWELHGLVRAYYLNDQRIEWSGQEATFGAEGVVAPMIRHRFGGWEISAEGEFFLNQPFDRNILLNNDERRSYAANFEVNTFEIWQLLVRARWGDLMFAAGKMETPFGRYYFPLYTNARIDAPFIRTEAILWRETGALAHYKWGYLVLDAAVANGSEDRDTNSSKALIGRVGLEDQNWAVGFSIKHQDGIGSEEQKQYNSHVGVDAMYRFGPFILSAEAIYDQYGFVRPELSGNSVFWGRSIYYRDQNYRDHVPICGFGYYVNLTYQSERWTGVLNYGEYYPGFSGDWRQEIVNRRGIAKIAYAFTPHLQWYNALILETDGYIAQDGRPRKGSVVLTGVEYGF